jgi:hypothetical protein
MFGYMSHAELVEALRGGPLRTSFDKLRMTQQMSFPFQNPMELITQDDKLIKNQKPFFFKNGFLFINLSF